MFAEQGLAGGGDWVVRVFVDGRTWDVEIGKFRVEESHERAHEAALGLAFFAEEEHVVAGEDGVDDFGDDGGLVADDAGEEVFVLREGGGEVGLEFLLDGAGAPAGAAEVGEGGWESGHGGGYGGEWVMEVMEVMEGRG